MDKMDSQNKRVYEYMKQHGSITRIEAMMDLGVANLPARINELRKSQIEIVTEMVEGKNRFGEKCSHAQYTLKEDTPDKPNHGCPQR